MTDVCDEVPQASLEVDLLLAAKLSAPAVRPGSVSRAALVSAVRGSGCRVVGVTAPAGYGKSSFLSELAQVEHRRVAWVSLDRLDDDPIAMLALIAAAFAAGGGASSSRPVLVGPGASPLARAAPQVAAMLSRSEEPFVLVLDDLHELTAPACHDALGVVIAAIPSGSLLVTASRWEQPHLPSLRAAGDLVEVTAADLALDADGAGAVFAAAGVAITPEAAGEVTARTEGWPAGLYLAAQLARRDPEELARLTGEHRFVADYLYQESFRRLPEATQRFLRRTAVLDQLNGPLCEAVTGDRGGQQTLRQLEATNMFLVAMDERRHWYRYHGLYREFLLGELQRSEPEAVRGLHLRAADWYEDNGSPALALEHLLNTDERSRCVALVTQLTLPTYELGQISTVQRWLATLGDPTIEANPCLAVLAGWVSAMSGRITQAQRWAAVADAASYSETPLDGSASFDSARAMLRAFMCAHGPGQMMADADLALAAEPEWSPWRETALSLSAHAHLLTGDRDRAATLFAEIPRVRDDLGSSDTFVDAEAGLAVLAMDRGGWSAAAEHLARALAVVEKYQLHDYPASVLAFAGAARLALHRGDRPETERELTRAMRARPVCTAVMPYYAVRTRLELAKVYWARGEQTAARHLVREIDEVLRLRPALGVLTGEVTQFRTIVAAGARDGVHGESPLTPAELRLLPYLQTHLTLSEIGERNFITQNTVRTHVASIYRKFGVSSRKDAVEQATAIGLLGAD
ncbi:MAG: LuxR C-terminal-related transcriptional regulator [Nocardioides sp.]